MEESINEQYLETLKKFIMSVSNGDEKLRMIELEKMFELHRVVKKELKKGEGVCKETENILYNLFEINNFPFKEYHKDKTHYYSGRKKGVFDEWGTLIETYIDAKNERKTSLKVISFSKDEIESYAKSYRTYRCFFDGGLNFVKVFEFKPSKI